MNQEFRTVVNTVVCVFPFARLDVLLQSEVLACAGKPRELGETELSRRHSDFYIVENAAQVQTRAKAQKSDAQL